MPKVLLVEDSDVIQRMYSVGLTKEGFEVTAAASAGEALARAEEEHFDILLLDMMLSGMSGLDFLDTSNVQGKNPDIVVVGLSNIDSPNVIERAKDHGITDYLIKSETDPRMLADRLKQLLAARPPASPGSSAK